MKQIIRLLTTLTAALVLTGLFVLPVWACDCQQLPELEPNDLETDQDLQDLGSLQPESCIEVVNAAIDSGFDRNTKSGDLDFYWVSLDSAGQLPLDL